MSDELDAPEDGDQNIRNLREKAKQADDLAAQLAASQRELAFSKAGLDLSDPKLSYFTKGYDGDLTPEAIRAEAESAGFLAKPEPAQPVIPQDEADALSRIAGMAMTGGVDPALASPPSLDGDLDEAIRRGEVKTPEQIGTFLAARGQPVAWDGPAQDGNGNTSWTSLVR